MAKKSKHLVLRALRSVQAKDIEIFAFFVPGETIMQIADISRIHHDEKSDLVGFQRKEIVSHVKSIVEYLNQGDILFPNAIILAVGKEVEFRQARGRDPEDLVNVADMGTLSIPLRSEGERVAWIVDGQQRSLALSKTRNKNIPVPVIAFVAPDIETQRSQFILVNKAKPLPTRLINELLPEVDTHLPRDLAVRKIPSELCNLLNKDPDSPFYKLIRRSSEKNSVHAVIVDTALIDVLKKSISNPLGALAQHRGVGDEAADINAMYGALLIFWTGVRKAFKNAWGLSPTKSRLMHSAGIKAMGSLMDRMLTRALTTSNPVHEINSSLHKIAPYCCWTSGTWEGLGLRWNEVQNVNSHVRTLGDYLIRLDYNAKMGDL